ncbi:peptide chain release factor 1 [Patescibacteria group bacterium AH-259-L05]|nr:peptide chain release factor 1 [Patescibacteria group bacterium AH-259-L05]
MSVDVEQLKQQLTELEGQLQDPEFYNTPEKLSQISQKYNQAKELLRLVEELGEINKKLAETQKLREVESNEEMVDLIDSEIQALQKKKNEIEEKITHNTKQSSKLDTKDAIIEIRAGTGGEEAALFAADLFRMYRRFAEQKQWKINLISSHSTNIGGLKEVIFEIKGPNVYGTLKTESGVHRVQRIPETEKNGRLHTSAASVVVLPEAQEVDITIDPKDLKIDTFRASGHGGQNVQKNETAVRITHLPTNLVVSCQDERSQGQNKERAMTILRSRLLAQKEEKKQKELKQKRQTHIGTGDRSEKIRTYNFPQDRITDHRIKKSWHGLEQILDGHLDPIIATLQKERSK